MAYGRERQVSGHQRLAVRRQLAQQTDTDTGRLLGVVFEAVEPVGVLESNLKHGVAGERQPIAAGRQTDDAVSGVWPPVRWISSPGATSYSVSNGRNWLPYSFKNRLAARRSASGNPGGMETREKSGDAQNSASAAARWIRKSGRSRSLTPPTSRPPMWSMCK